MSDEKRQRDAKGRFVKGNTEGKRFQTGDGRASEAGLKGNIAQKENQRRRKLLRETLMEELEKETARGSGVTKQEAIVAAVVKNLYDKPNAKGLKIMTEILGEMEINVNLNQAEKPKIVFDDGEDE